MVSAPCHLPLFQSDSAANHLVLGLYGDARVNFGAEGRRILAGSRHWFAFETLSYEWEHRAQLGTEHAIAFVGQHALVLSPWVRGEWTSVDYTEDADDFLDVRAGLSFELPL